MAHVKDDFDPWMRLRRLDDADGRALLELLNALVDHAEGVAEPETIAFRYHAREGWIVEFVGLMRTDDIDTICRTVKRKPQATLLGALRVAVRELHRQRRQPFERRPIQAWTR